MNPLLAQQLQKAQGRFNARTRHRDRNLRLIQEHRYFAIDSPQRVKKFLDRRGISASNVVEILRSEKGVPGILKEAPVPKQFTSLERILGTNDLVGVSFLHTAIEISKTVGRIWVCGPGNKLVGYGTGFLVSPSLMLTNHHVLPNQNVATNSKIEFRYELDENNKMLQSECFDLDPNSFFVANEELDFSMVGVKPENGGKIFLGEFGWNKLAIEEGKAIISQWLNLIQHPNGMPKQIGLRENQLIDVLENFLHYKTDTSPGSSGSPVYNEQWEVVALHHAGKWQEDENGNILNVNGGMWNQSMGDDQIKWIANEGVRISRILKYLDRYDFTSNEERLYDEMRTATPPRTYNTERSNKTATQTMNSDTIANADGSVTMTVPLTINIRLGANNQAQPQSQQNASASNVVDKSNNSETDILRKAKEEFLKRGDVLKVRLGYLFRNGWITKDRAIVVTVKEKKSREKLRVENIAALPDTFMSYPVEITTPTLQDLVSSMYGPDVAESLLTSPDVTAEEITYFPPDGTPLKEVTDNMRVVAHVSPEQGWKILHPFLRGTQKTLTVGMYDLGSPHIITAIKDAASKNGFKKMVLTLQPGESVGKGTKANDFTDQEAIDELANALDEKFEHAWIRRGSVNGWISSSYHIKVAVRDSKAFWISSGNWQSSNQPELNGDLPSARTLLNKYNREWHAIVENQELAKVFEAYIKHDFENNSDYDPSANELIFEQLNLLVPLTQTPGAEEAHAELKRFEPFDDTREFKVTPLLTPDNYFDKVLELVKSAKKELLIQNQTFNAPKENHMKLQQLMTAILDRQEVGVDVRIIFRAFIPSVARENLENLVDIGFDASKIKVHDKLHTKGIIVDGKVVLLGSQNISNDGISVNRDASLLFKDEPLAQYFREIFEHDYYNLAKQNIGRENISIEVATDTKNIPEGMELLTWSEIKELI